MARSFSLRATGQRLFANWAVRRQGSQRPPLILYHRLVYILPTRAGLGFGVLLGVIWIGSLNYSLNLGYLLAFWLAACGLLSMFWCFRNQSGLRISYGSIQPVFAGQIAQFPLLLNNPDALPRNGIELSWGEGILGECDINACGQSEILLPLPATRRGWLYPGRVTLANRQPLGLFRAWSYLYLDWACLVYPQPETNPPALPDIPEQLSTAGQYNSGDDDFFALRGHVPADSPKHVAWRQAARDGVLRTKQYAGGSVHRVWLDFDALPASLDTESKLARLTAWVLLAHASGCEWGLRLPGQQLALNRGQAHRDACLKQLALVGPGSPP